VETTIRLLTLLLSLIASVPATTAAEERVPSVGIIDAKLRARGISTSDCGYYALIAAAAAIDHPLDSKDLFGNFDVNVSYLGITQHDLLRLAEREGLTAVWTTGIATADLHATNCPLIIPLRSAAGADQNHWVTICGIEGENANIYDNIDAHPQRSLAEIDLVWNGEAMILATSPAMAWNCKARLWAVGVARKAFFVLAAFAIAAGVAFGARRKTLVAGNAGLLIGCAATLFLACGFSWFYQVGKSTELMLMTHCWEAAESKTDSVGEQCFRDLNGISKPVLVDCRARAYFDEGALPGAVNMPIRASMLEWREFIQSISKDQTLVFYCQSKDCGWASLCRRRLQCLGVKSEVLCGGFQEFVTSKF